MARALALAIAIAALGACTPTSSNSQRPSAAPSPSAKVFSFSLGSVNCEPPAAFHGWQGPNGLPETGLDSPKGSLWALFFYAVPPPSGKEIKIVWRMTGEGTFAFTVSNSRGETVPLAWGPDVHGGSNWNHPGDEVGTGITFPHAGCWVIHVARTDVSGDLWLEVAS